jgi:two-component system sensor histidine kinase KdpD
VLTSTLELDEVLALVVDRLVRVYPGSSGGILLRHESGEAVLRASSGALPRSALAAARTALAESRPIVEGDGLALPLIAGDRLVGAVALHVPGQTEFENAEVAFVGTLANQAALAIDKASLYALARTTAESLRELDRARSDFVAVVTHDLRTPLSVVRGYLDLFAEQAGKNKNGHRLPLAEASAQVERLDHLVDRILASVKDDRPDINIRRARFDLRGGLVAAVRELGPMARKHTLRGPRAGVPLWARGDKRRTAEVVAGLVHNATKYAPAGTGISVSVSKAKDRALVRVADEGPGVPPEDRRRIFEPFVRLGSDEISGAGIGLFSCRRVVEAQGGSLWYEDQGNGKHGSVFVFSVPLSGGDDR